VYGAEQYESEQLLALCEPRPPHVAAALRHTPLSQTPPDADPVQLEPAATHLLLTQQPRPAHVLPSQQGWPGPPQVAQLLPLHARPEPVQKLAAERLLEPAQQLWPSPPQVPQPPGAVSEQAPVSVPPHAAPAATHLSPAQQASPAHTLLPQHGWFTAPQLWNDPATHTVFGFDPDAPGATQRFVVASRHEPLVHPTAPGHGAVPAMPQ
jgi:hypothetical protein